MKYQLSDLVNGQYGKIFTNKSEAEQELKWAIEEGKRLNLKYSDGETCMGTWEGKPQKVEDFISLVEIEDDEEEKPVIVKWYGATGEFKPTYIIDGVAYFGKEFMREVDGFGRKQVYAPLPFTENVEMYDTAAIRKHKIDRWCVSQFGGFYYGVIQH